MQLSHKQMISRRCFRRIFTVRENNHRFLSHEVTMIVEDQFPTFVNHLFWIVIV